MKNKTIALILACAFITSIGSLAACSIGSTEHTHTFSDEWTYDDTYHWHSAECVHLSETKDKAEHTFDEGTATEATFESAGYITYGCTVCGYEKQVVTSPALEHNYSDTLTHDNGDTHWYACTDEGYENLKKDEAAHNLTETDYDEATGYATYVCECGFTRQYLRTVITSLPTVADTTVYIGQKLSDITLTGGSANVEGTFVWSAPDAVISASGDYGVTFNPTDTEYAPVTGIVGITATQLTVTVEVGENGTASQTGTVNVNYDSSLTITFTPDSGYMMDTLTVDGEEVTASTTYTFENVTENHTISATFTEQVLPFTLTYVSGTENAYTFENNVLTFTTIEAETVYAISGEFEGNIVIDVGDNYKFELEMRGFTLTCDYINPIMILSGDEVTLTAKKGYDNYIYDNREAIDSTDETLYSSAVYSFVDLQVSGKGTLTVVSENNNGIHTKDDLQVKNLTLSVTCMDNALKGNDSVTIESGSLVLIARQGDGIKTSNTDISSKGNQRGTVTIAGGDVQIYAACDGIDAAYDVVIDGATTVLNIYTDKYSEYSEEVTDVSESVYYIRFNSTAYSYSLKFYNDETDVVWCNSSSSTTVGNYRYFPITKPSGYAYVQLYIYNSTQQQGQAEDYLACTDGLTVNNNYDTIALQSRGGMLSYGWTNYGTTSMGGGMGGMGGMNDGNTDKGDYSTKGIKADNEITINAGTINIKSYDDAIHANNDGGTLENGEEPTGNVTINGGTITVYSNDDGIHADGTLTIIDGTISVTNSYEGLEGTFISIQGGNISVISSDDGVNAMATSGCGITISGGTVYVNANGDGLDSNSKDSYGGILFAGGKTVVICKSGGNSAIDTESGYKHTGGQVVAIMTSSGMTSETGNGNSIGMTKKTSLSLSNGGYLTVTVDSATVATVQMPCAMTAYVVYLGSSSATIASASSTSAALDSNGVYWA
ncbi:MAG: carbohydrate-binding domain-containing protein [Candidatus Coproplasma sp.]